MKVIALTSIIAIILISFAGIGSSTTRETSVTATIGEFLIFQAPASFGWNSLSPPTSASYNGVTHINTNMDWELLGEDNSHQFFPPYGPGNGRMTKQPYIETNPNSKQLERSLKLTADGNILDLATAPYPNARHLTLGGPGEYYVTTTFTQDVTLKDRPGSYTGMVTLYLTTTI